jgi:hypothetical protein
MRRITLTLDSRLAAWAQERAARRDQSLSQFVSELLHSKMREYDSAMQRFISKQPVRLNTHAIGYPKRDTLHDGTDHE